MAAAGEAMGEALHLARALAHFADKGALFDRLRATSASSPAAADESVPAVPATPIPPTP